MILQNKLKIHILKFILLLIFISVFACAGLNKDKISEPTYEEWLATCKDYRDVANWQKNIWFMIKNDCKRPYPTLRQTYRDFRLNLLKRLSTGSAESVVQGKLYIMDYGTTCHKTEGTHGP